MVSYYLNSVIILLLKLDLNVAVPFFFFEGENVAVPCVPLVA